MEAKWQPLREAINWMAQYRIFWENRFDRLEDYLNTIQTEENSNDKS